MKRGKRKRKIINLVLLAILILELIAIFDINEHSLVGQAIKSVVSKAPTCVPSQEICDGKDNDCDKQVDEGGVCWDATCQYPLEIVDGKDNDCDGEIDEVGLYLRSDKVAPSEAEQKATASSTISRDVSYEGYIIELKNKPVLAKKKELENQLSDNDEVLSVLSLYKNQLEISHSKSKADFNRILGKSIDSKIRAEFVNVFNGIALDISDEEAKRLEESVYVKAVYPDFFVYASLMDSVPLINADDVWRLQDNYGRNITGQNVSIAIIDTGVDYTHSDLGGCFGTGCKVIDGYDFVNNDNNPMDDHGHGTHVAATAAGNGDYDGDGFVEEGEGLNGVAPDAEVYAYKVLSSSGSGSTSRVILGVERAVDPDQDGNFEDHVDIISMSLGNGLMVSLPEGQDTLRSSLGMAVDAGVVAVVAAGNSYDYKYISSPAVSEKVISVGASDKSDIIADFSSKGPADVKGFPLKPDLVAPGVSICAAQWDNAWADKECYDNSHVAISGTSMATPHVAGAAALIKQKYPNISPLETKSLLSLGSSISTKRNLYKGKTWYPSYYSCSSLYFLEFCTKVHIGLDINKATAIMFFERQIPSVALIRSYSGQDPGDVLQQTSWIETYSGKYEAEFSNLAEGDYWLCSEWENEIGLARWLLPVEHRTEDRGRGNTGGWFDPYDPYNTCSVNDLSLQLKYQIPSSVYDEGAGRLDVQNSINLPIITNESSLSFGVVNNSNIIKKFTITNIGAHLLNLSVQPSLSRRSMEIKGTKVIESLEEYNYLSVNPEHIFLLSPGETVEIELYLNVSESAKEGYYSGKIILFANDNAYDIPYSFIILDKEYYTAPYSSNTPVIDGVINNEEWSDASYYSGFGGYDNIGIYLKTGVMEGKDMLFIAFKPVLYGNIDLFFDEGDDGEYGSGSFDYLLRISQEDYKYRTPTGHLDGDYGIIQGLIGWGACGRQVDYLANLSLLEGSTYLYQLEFAIPLVDTNPGIPCDDYFFDYSDINVDYNNILGIMATFLYRESSSGPASLILIPEEANMFDAFTFKGILIESPSFCSDGTRYGECSSTKPKYCDNGNLINNCQLCGCPGTRKCCPNGDCAPINAACIYPNVE